MSNFERPWKQLPNRLLWHWHWYCHGRVGVHILVFLSQTRTKNKRWPVWCFSHLSLFPKVDFVFKDLEFACKNTLLTIRLKKGIVAKPISLLRLIYNLEGFKWFGLASPEHESKKILFLRWKTVQKPTETIRTKSAEEIPVVSQWSPLARDPPRLRPTLAPTLRAAGHLQIILEV